MRSSSTTKRANASGDITIEVPAGRLELTPEERARFLALVESRRFERFAAECPSEDDLKKEAAEEFARAARGEPCNVVPFPRKVPITFFSDEFARKLSTKELLLTELRDLILATTAKTKAQLPWLKLAVFGDERTHNKSLRHNGNVKAINGVELDYDGELMSFDDGVKVLRQAELQALIYTSPSNTAAKPRWRLVLPSSKPLPPAERVKLVARVNGLFSGVFSRESFTLSQAYYFGSIDNNPDHRAVVTKGDCVDLRDELGNINTEAPSDRVAGDPFTEHAAEVLKLNKTPPPGKIAAAMATIPNTIKTDRAQWIRIGHALKRELPGDDGLELFKQWSKSWAGWGEGEYDQRKREAYTVEKWRSFKPHSIGAGTLFRLADEASPGWWERAQKGPIKNLEVWDAGDDVEPPPPRAWLLGNSFARKFMSTVFADGGIGKTALRYAQLVALATGIPITGENVFQRCRVLIVSLEDDRDEFRRRILAVLKHHKIDRSELKGWLFYCTPNADSGKLMALDKYGQIKRDKLADSLETIITTHGIDIISIDPFVKSHSVEENQNSAIDNVVQVLTDLGSKYNIAVDAPHHVTKGAGEPGNADRGRGASSMKDAARLVYTLTRMNEKEAEAFGIDEKERPLFIRLDSGKVNILPPATSAKWFQLIGIPLDNGNDLYPNGDEVQTVEPWVPPSAWEDMDANLQNRILTAIDAGLLDGNRYTDSPNAGEREAWTIVVKHAPQKTEAQAKQIIKTWVEMGVLEGQDYTNPKTRKPVRGLHLDPKKRP